MDDEVVNVANVYDGYFDKSFLMFQSIFRIYLLNILMQYHPKYDGMALYNLALGESLMYGAFF